MNLPNKISVSRIILIPFFMAAYMLAKPFGDYWIYISAGLFAVASFTDFLDGHIARKRGLVTDVGNFLDTVADKMLVVAALILIAGYTLVPQIPGIIIATLIISRELAVLALKMIAAINKVVIVADKLGKIKAAVQLVAIPVILPAKPLDKAVGFTVTTMGMEMGVFAITGFILLAASALLALLAAGNYFLKNKKVFQAKAKANDKLQRANGK